MTSPHQYVVFLLVIFLGALAVCQSLAEREKEVKRLLTSIEHEWKEYKNRYGKKYGNTEDAKRKNIYVNNKLEIERNNKLYAEGHVKYKMAVNHLTDFRPLDIAVRMMQDKEHVEVHKHIVLATFHPNNLVPSQKDWRLEKAVSPVKIQGECGSCWAFTATGAIESQYAIKTKRMVTFSEQNLVDCSQKRGNMGCAGGIVAYAFRYIKDKGIATEQSYPYRDMDQDCQTVDPFPGLKLVGFKRTMRNDEDQMKQALATQGPVAVAIDANHTSFTFYSRGILYEPNCNEDSPTHAVLVVGYGSENGEDYWIVKNSWGPDWGEGGYIRMSRNKNNNCGIASNAIYPIIETTSYIGGTSRANLVSVPIYLLLFNLFQTL